MSDDLSKYVREARNEMMNQVMTLYHRDDFFRKLDELTNGRGTSEFDSIKFQLKRMMQARGFPKDVVESLAQSNKDSLNREYFRAYIIEKVPTEKELVVVLLESIYNLYCKFPSNERFMSRIIKRITNDAFPSDSLRMKILKRFIINTDYHTQAIALRTGTNQTAQIIERLTENIFSRPTVADSDWQRFFTRWQKRQQTDYFTIVTFNDVQGNVEDREKKFFDYLSKFNLVENGNVICRRSELYGREKIAFLIDRSDIFEIFGKVVGRFYARINDYFAFLERIITSDNKLAELAPLLRRRISQKSLEDVEKKILITVDLEKYKSDKKKWLFNNYGKRLNDDLEEVLRKNFLGLHGVDEKCFTNFLDKQIKNNRPNFAPAALTPETVVEYLKQFPDPNPNKKSIGHVFQRAWKDFRDALPYMDMTLMNLADNLASANFNFYGSLKEELYLFAFAYDMGFSDVDKDHEIVNLFYDFYNDNFLRFENPPPGDGINFKNYLEIIYLYWLNKKNLLPSQRLACAEQFIDEVYDTASRLAQASNASQRARILKAPAFPTYIYRKKFFEDILDFNEEQFKNYLLDNYHIYRAGNNNRIMMASETRTLKRYLLDLVAKINSYPQEEDLEEYVKDAYHEKGEYYESPATLDEFCRMDIGSLINYLQKNYEAQMKCISADTEFISWLKKMENSLDVNRYILHNKKFFDKTRYARTDLIALYYYWFSNFALDDLIFDDKVVDWEELLDAFLNGFNDSLGNEHLGLNSYLSECGLQLFSSKVLYDSFILFFLFLEIVW